MFSFSGFCFFISHQHGYLFWPGNLEELTHLKSFTYIPKIQIKCFDSSRSNFLWLSHLMLPIIAYGSLPRILNAA